MYTYLPTSLLASDSGRTPCKTAVSHAIRCYERSSLCKHPSWPGNFLEALLNFLW